ncbi:MAG: universal stress protein [Rhizobiales bacterium]|nr:universal stress protein [Hyphomicrobiales bacterium]
MFKNILIPVALNPENDISKVVAAAGLLVSKGGKLTMLHVLEEVPRYVADRLPKTALKESQQRAESDLETLATAAGPDVARKMVEGHGARTILAEAQRMGTDCIVMGSHTPGIGDYLIGSTSAYVVRHATCPVFVIR